MTEPSDNTATRPISVAELLAKNGTIGSPPVGGRRRRRRGNADAVTVAELTGEIPIIADDDEAPEPAAEETVEETAEPTPEPAPEVLEEPEPEPAPLPEPEPAPEQQPEETHPRRRAHVLSRRDVHPSAGGAEEMTFDPLHDEDLSEDADGEPPAAVKTRPSYLKSSADALFGGDSVADDAARRDLEDTQRVAVDFDEPLDADEPPEQSPLMRGVWIVAQSVLAVALGAGLFIAFDQLWKWNNIVALALSVLVILGLVVGVRVVRKTEDIASTLIAVAVGAMVTLGPLALLQST